MTRLQLVEHLLTDAGSNGVTTSAFLRAGAGSRFGARVQELRDQGQHITCSRVRDGEFRYVLTPSEPLSWSWSINGGWQLLSLSEALSRGSYEQERAAA